jgi:type I restriction-modification system DNA methylase subunit
MTMKTISRDGVNNVAWRACDTFRGTIDPTQYKDYILLMLFLKYLSDVWKDKKEEYEKEFKGDAERVKRRLARERFEAVEAMGRLQVPVPSIEVQNTIARVQKLSAKEQRLMEEIRRRRCVLVDGLVMGAVRRDATKRA